MINGPRTPPVAPKTIFDLSTRSTDANTFSTGSDITSVGKATSTPAQGGGSSDCSVNGSNNTLICTDVTGGNKNSADPISNDAKFAIGFAVAVGSLVVAILTLCA